MLVVFVTELVVEEENVVDPADVEVAVVVVEVVIVVELLEAVVMVVCDFTTTLPSMKVCMAQ